MRWGHGLFYLPKVFIIRVDSDDLIVHHSRELISDLCRKVIDVFNSPLEYAHKLFLSFIYSKRVNVGRIGTSNGERLEEDFLWLSDIRHVKG